MSSNDDTVIVRKIVDSLRSLIADLDVEIGEEGGTYSKSLDAAQRILQDAVKRLEFEISKPSQ
jgi:hypothetical protein